jgi:hypothetical protein
MSYVNHMQDDEDWQRTNKISPFGHLKHLCFKAFYWALVGKPFASVQSVPAPMLSEAPNESPNRSKLP